MARERALLAALRGHFDPVLDEPVPERLADLLRAPAATDAAPAKAVPPPARRTARERRPRWVAPA